MRVDGLHQVAQRAADPARASDWYCDVLGARALARFDPPGLAFVELAGTRILLKRSASPATLYLAVADVTAAYEELRGRGVAFVDEPHLIHRDDDGTFGPPGSQEWMVFLRDPDGNLLALAERRPPPAASADGP